MKSSIHLLLSGAALATLLFAGCGQGNDASPPVSSADGVRSVTITANDTMKFS